MRPALTDPESARLEALSSYNILDTLPEEDYDAITRIAAQICGMPISLITLLDDHRQWFKASIGIHERQTPREYAFCSHAIETPDQMLEVPDARADARFMDNPLTTDEPHVIFYAGVPLVDEDGHALGTLCVIDNKPNKLSEQQADALKSLGRQVVTLLKLRRSQLQLSRANEELNETNRVLRAVFDNCPAAVVLWQAVREKSEIVDFKYIFTNPVYAAITGYSIEQMTGNYLKRLFPGVVRSRQFDRLVKAVSTGERQDYEEFYQADGISIWGIFSIVPLGDSVLFTIQDITRLKETEEQLRLYSENLEQLVSERTAEIGQLSARQNAILEYAGLAIVSTGADGTIQTVNPATETMFGYSASELIGLSDTTFLFDPVDLAKQARTLSVQVGRPVDGGLDLFKLMATNRGYECTMISKNGQRIPILLVATALKASAGVITGYIVMATDITTLKAARTELKKKNQELNTFFEVALDLHCIADTSGNILKTNRAWQTTLGYTTEELLTLNHFDLVHPDDRNATRLVVSQATPEHTNVNHMNRFRRKDGVYRLIEWNVVAIDNLLYASARDITEQHQAERQLKIVNQRLQLATQAANQGIWEYNRQQDRLIWDDQMYAIHGLTRTDQALKLSDYERLVHPDDFTTFDQRRMQSRHESFSYERRIIWPDGTVRHTELHGLRLSNKAGKPTGSVGVVRDITGRKAAELAHRQNEERYRLLVESLKEVVYQTNKAGDLTFLNPFWATMTGYTIEESLGKPFYAYLHPKEQGKARDLFNEFVAQQKTSTRFVIRYQHRNGDYCWAEAFAQLVTNDAGQPIGITGTITDITERKQALDALRRSEQRFRDIAENINEVFWIHSAQPFQLLYVNPAYELITGLSPEALYTDPVAFLTKTHPDDHPIITDALVRYLQGEEITVQFRITDATGTMRWFSLRTFVKKSHSGAPLNYIGIATDITSQKEQEFVLQQSLQREQELNRLKSQFVSTASHEFRTPLATIQSSVDLIKLYSDKPPATAQPAIQRHLGIIEKEIVNFSNLLADILTFGKIDAGKISFAPQPVDVLDLAQEVIATHFASRPDGRTVQFSRSGTPRLIQADVQLLSHALVNLLSNAFKFSTDNPRLHVDFEAAGLKLIISDTGIGIPADELTHLFETFFRARNAVNIQGSGLGLVITRQFIEQHGGRLSVFSQENEGTVCTVILPDGAPDAAVPSATGPA